MTSRIVRSLVALGVAASLCASSASTAVSVAVFHHPRVPTERGSAGSTAGWASSNWSGYAIGGSSGQFSSVTGTWVVQAASATKKATYSSQWVGIDGFTNGSLIQTGTESDYSNGAAHYSVWWEILPAPVTLIAMPVKPGDLMSASITKGGGSSWTITITNVTQNNNSFTTTQAYSGPQSSAEWIEEAPTVNGHIATLAHYGTARFDGGPSATSFNTFNGHSPNLTIGESGVMIQNGVQVSTPSKPDADADGFNMEYGSTAPPAPTT